MKHSLLLTLAATLAVVAGCAGGAPSARYTPGQIDSSGADASSELIRQSEAAEVAHERAVKEAAAREAASKEAAKVECEDTAVNSRVETCTTPPAGGKSQPNPTTTEPQP